MLNKSLKSKGLVLVLSGLCFASKSEARVLESIATTVSSAAVGAVAGVAVTMKNPRTFLNFKTELLNNDKVLNGRNIGAASLGVLGLAYSMLTSDEEENNDSDDQDDSVEDDQEDDEAEQAAARAEYAREMANKEVIIRVTPPAPVVVVPAPKPVVVPAPVQRAVLKSSYCLGFNRPMCR